MDDLGISPDEFQTVVHACRWISPGGCAPDIFRDFVIARLNDIDPALAQKVRLLGDDQTQQLCELVKEQQEIHRWLDP